MPKPRKLPEGWSGPYHRNVLKRHGLKLGDLGRLVGHGYARKRTYFGNRYDVAAPRPLTPEALQELLAACRSADALTREAGDDVQEFRLSHHVAIGSQLRFGGRTYTVVGFNGDLTRAREEAPEANVNQHIYVDATKGETLAGAMAKLPSSTSARATIHFGPGTHKL